MFFIELLGRIMFFDCYVIDVLNYKVDVLIWVYVWLCGIL